MEDVKILKSQKQHILSVLACNACSALCHGNDENDHAQGDHAIERWLARSSKRCWSRWCSPALPEKLPGTHIARRPLASGVWKLQRRRAAMAVVIAAR